jgi:hypothetical protein
MTPTDWLQVISDRRPRWSILVRRIGAIALLGFSLWHLSSTGLDLIFAICIYVSICLFTGVSFFVWIIMCCFLAYSQPLMLVSIDNDSVSFGSKKSKQIFPWSSFVNYGSATESDNYFWLESGRGSVWIPKTAFTTKEEKDDFRKFVMDKMGDRCKFKL